MNEKILVVDDEKMIVKGLTFSLEQENYVVDTAYDGAEALAKIQANDYDIVLLDIMLPELNGYEVCQQVRGFSDVPIIMLTAKGEDMDKILGLDYGADDYMTKPFNILEVKARIKAILRRNRKTVSTVIFRHDGLEVNSENHRVRVHDREINLTTKEFDILQLLIANPNKIFSRDKLLELVWGENYAGEVRTVDVHVRRLREKIEENPSRPKYVYTKWGVGYYFRK